MADAEILDLPAAAVLGTMQIEIQLVAGGPGSSGRVSLQAVIDALVAVVPPETIPGDTIINQTINASKLELLTITDAQIANLTIITNKYADNSVTYGKLQTISAPSRLLGRGTAGGANTREISLGAGLSMTGDVLDAVGGAGGINQLTGGVTAGPGVGSQPAVVADIPNTATLTASGTPPTNAVGYLGTPQNLALDAGNYTNVMADCGKALDKTTASARVLTIDSNANVACPIGTILCGSNEGAGALTIQITADTLRWGSSTGTRTVAQNGSWAARKVTATVWRLTGDGIT